MKDGKSEEDSGTAIELEIKAHSFILFCNVYIISLGWFEEFERFAAMLFALK